MIDQYFAMRLIRRHGSTGANVVAALATLAAAVLLWPATRWGAIPLALIVGSLAFIIGRSYVELVCMVFEKLN
ncbi:MAG: hypothetical protein ABSD02_22475 [Steroidobacteraceae bacterium]|jgi:hypothetical protein